MALNVALVLLNGPAAGGGFQQALATILTLLNADIPHRFRVMTTVEENLALLNNYGVAATHLRYGAVSKTIHALTRGSVIGRRFDNICSARLGWAIGKRLDQLLVSNSIDIAYFLEPAPLASYLIETNYITTVWDLCHRDFTEFPEVRDGREQWYQNQLPKAIAVITNSIMLSQRISSYYGVDKSRIHILPLLPAVGIQRHLRLGPLPGGGIERYHIKKPYAFYPANFWPHKNHVYILEALAGLRDRRRLCINVAFSGSDQGNLSRVRRRVNDLNLDGQVHFLGYVEDSDMPILYREALALVMPTYFGPTNIPPIEAFALDCPVVYSDFETFREQMGEAVLYCDLSDPDSLASHLEDLACNPRRSAELSAKGKEIITRNSDQLYREVLYEVLGKYEYIARRWR